MIDSKCPFCALPENRLLHTQEGWNIIRDAYPVSPGHTLIIPRRHINSFFELNEDEFVSLFPLLCEIKEQLENEYSPQGFNIGVNDGKAAGQTVMHMHVHLIPRYAGDVEDPRGGIRLMFPDKARYWEGGNVT